MRNIGVKWIVLGFMLMCFSSAASSEPVKPVHAKVEPHNGAPAVFINGKPVFPNGFVAVCGGDPKLVKEMAGAGVHIYMDSPGIGNDTEGKYDYTGIDQYFERVIASDSKAYFLPRIATAPSGWGTWCKRHPDECIVFADGHTGRASYASKLQEQEASRDIALFIKHIRSSQYADRVLGFLVCPVQGDSGEWFGLELWDGHVGDFSKPCLDAFRDWLRAKYRTDSRLRKAWKDPNVTLDTAAVPTVDERRAITMFNFRDPAKEGLRVTDWYLYYSDLVADSVCHYACVVKEASDGEMLAGFFYGYLNTFGSFQQESQNNAITRVINCPDIDFFASPAQYAGRRPGGTSNFMTMAESVQLHGKVHFDESDIRTHSTSADAYPGRCATPEETEGVLKREMGHVLSRGQALWWFDMAYGWFSDSKTLDVISKLKKASDDTMTRPREGNAQIAVVYDDKSWAVCRPGSSVGVASDVEWPRVGASQDYYVLSDIANPKMPKHKLYVFVNAYYITDREVCAIHDRLKREHATALWIYAPGYVTDGGLSTKHMEKLTGIRLVCETKALPTTMTIDRKSPLVKSEDFSEPVGCAQASGPVFYADDPRAEVVGELDALNKPGFVVKKMDGWTSIFYASPALPPHVLRAVARYAGVHIYSSSNDCFYADRGIICLHAAASGEKVISLPGKCNVYDLITGEKVASDRKSIKLYVKEKDTVLLRMEERRL